MIKGWECYKLTKINRVYFTPAIFIESKELTPPIGYVATEDGEQRFSISLQHRKNFVDNRIGTCWVDDLGEFLYLCERLGCYVEVDIVGLEVFLQAHEEVRPFLSRLYSEDEKWTKNRPKNRSTS